MDRMIYIAMTGAREVTRQQASVSHNLANLSTHGFREQLNVFRALPVVGEGAKTRAFVLETTPRSDFTQGALQQTGPLPSCRPAAGRVCAVPGRWADVGQRSAYRPQFRTVGQAVWPNHTGRRDRCCSKLPCR